MKLCAETALIKSELPAIIPVAFGPPKYFPPKHTKSPDWATFLIWSKGKISAPPSTMTGMLYFLAIDLIFLGLI